jgi:hypothetical protein
MTRQIGGDRITLRAIAGADQDAHGFQPKPSDAAALTNAAVMIRNGLGFEGWLDRMIRSSGFKGRLVTTTEGITPRMMEAHAHHGHDHGGAGRRHNHSVGPRQVPDPHAWQDVGLAQHYIRNITGGLVAADPGGEALYRRNAEAYAARLTALDQWVRAEIAKVPAAPVPPGLRVPLLVIVPVPALMVPLPSIVPLLVNELLAVAIVDPVATTSLPVAPLVKLLGVMLQAPPVVEAIVPLLMIGAVVLLLSVVVPVPELCSVTPGPILRV